MKMLKVEKCLSCLGGARKVFSSYVFLLLLGFSPKTCLLVSVINPPMSLNNYIGYP